MRRRRGRKPRRLKRVRVVIFAARILAFISDLMLLFLWFDFYLPDILFPL